MVSVKSLYFIFILLNLSVSDTKVSNMYSANSDDTVASGPRGLFNYGKVRLLISCPRYGFPLRRCGRFKVTKEQCNRFRCCWRPANAFAKSARCVNPNYNILNRMASSTFQDWGQWGRCIGMSKCAPGTQYRYRKCIGPICRGTAREPQTCLTPGCTPEEHTTTLPTTLLTSASTMTTDTPSSTTHTIEILTTSTVTTDQTTMSSSSTNITNVTPLDTTTATDTTTSHTGTTDINATTTASTTTSEPVTTSTSTGTTVTVTSSTTTTFAWASWYDWTGWSRCTIPAEPDCVTGTKTRNRDCVLSGAVVPGSTLGCEFGHSSETVPCNGTLCKTMSPWTTGECSSTCGFGTVVQVRFCAEGASSTPESCFTKISNCSGLPTCPSINYDIDLVLIMDSTTETDQCVLKELLLEESAPFPNSLTRQNFPNFFAQKDFVANFHDSWSLLTSGDSRFAVLAHSGACLPSSSSNFYPLNFLNEVWNRNMLDLMPMFCDLPYLPNILTCAGDGMFTAPRGDRVMNPNCIILMMPNPLSTQFYDIKYTEKVLSDMKTNALQNVDKLFIVSTYNIDTLSVLDRDAVEYRYNALGCNTYGFGSCTRYIGHIYEPPSRVAERMLSIMIQG